MVYRNYHKDCKETECKILTAYVRMNSSWLRIGHYGSKCKKFESLDLQQEKQERLMKQKFNLINSEMRRFKEANKERLKTIKNELNVSKSFFK
jgi:hypothetical protein